MKKIILLALVLVLVLLSACAAEIVSVTADEQNRDATIEDIIVPFYLP